MLRYITSFFSIKYKRKLTVVSWAQSDEVVGGREAGLSVFTACPRRLKPSLTEMLLPNFVISSMILFEDLLCKCRFTPQLFMIVVKAFSIAAPDNQVGYTKS
jgi:hypothetical protein